MAQQSQSYKIPPKLGPDTDYETWKNEIEMWKLVTDLNKNKQALAVALTLTGKAREAALEIDAHVLNTGGGLTTLLNALDEVFEKEAKDLAYKAYTDFDKFRKGPDMSMADYIINFERLYNKSKKHRMLLLDAILAFKLLDNSGLDITKRQMALTATSELTFKGMKSSLNRIFGDTSNAESAESITVKADTESALYTRRGYGKTNGAQGGNSRGNGYGYRQQTQSDTKNNGNNGGPPRGTNPINRFGRRTKCACCQSVFHWIKDCPHKDKQENVNLTEDQSSANNQLSESMESCNITLFNKTENSCSSDFVFLIEAMGTAVIDTACTRTVCGRNWFEEYTKGLPENERKALTAMDSNIGFKFGDGKTVYSFQTVMVPACIAKLR